MRKRIFRVNSRFKPFLIYAAIIVVQLVVILYWADMKSNFFVDEFFSKGYAGGYTGEGDTARYLTVGPEWKFNEWVNNASFKKYLIVEEDEQIFRLPFFEAVKKILTGKNYFGLLNIAESIAGYSIVSARPGIVLNMIFFIVAEIALLIFMRKMKMAVRSQYLALAMFGFSAYCITFVEFIRFYMFVTMCLLWLLYLFYTVWNGDSFKKIIPTEFGILGLTYLAFKNSQFTMIFFGAFSFCFVIAMVISKRWKPLISYMIMGFCGVAYLWVTTDYIDILLHPTDYPIQRGKVVGASLSIAQFSIDITKTNVLYYMKILGDYYIADFFVALIAAIALTIYSLWLIRRKKENESLIKGSYMIRADILITVIAWIGLMGFSFLIQRGMIICVVIVCILLLRFLYELTGCKIRLQSFKLSSESIFACVMLGTAIIYTIVIAMANLVAWRYFCFAFVLYSIVFWYILDRILTKCIRGDLVFGWYLILTVFVAANVLIPFKTRNIPFVYEDDRNFKNALEPYRDMDVVLAAYIDTMGATSKRETYDCVNLMSEDSNIYALSLEEYTYDEEKFINEFILWGRFDQDLSPILNDLNERGYECESLGQDNASQAYVCRRN